LIAGMMEDPRMKKMIRDQQRGMLGQMYDPLISKMSLTPEEASKFKDMIADNMAKATESAGSLFGGSSSNRTEAVQRMVADQKVLDDQIRGFLGEDRYAQYRDYQDTVGERTQLNMFKQQSEGAALTEAQTEQLLTFMKEEKQTAMAASGFPASGPGQDEAGLQAMMSEEAGNKLLESQEQANQKVYERAAAVLSAEQLAAFGKFQTNQTQMMRMGIGMARQFLAPEGD
jgi:ribosomal protein L16 Arg81 hydroxylase